MEIKITE